MRAIAAFGSGVLFAVGLGVSGMTSPRKVIGFLDFFGSWDPSLLFVMGGAVGVFALAHLLSRSLAKPLAAGSFPSVPSRRVDGRLVGGAIVFGVGWGLAGYCPGPALVSVVSGAMPPVVFAAAMVLGLAARRPSHQGSDEGHEPSGTDTPEQHELGN